MRHSAALPGRTSTSITASEQRSRSSASPDTPSIACTSLTPSRVDLYLLLGDLRDGPLVGLPQDRHHLLFCESVFFMAPSSDEGAIPSGFNWSEKRRTRHPR